MNHPQHPPSPPHQGNPQQGYPPQGYPPQGYPPQGYPPQGYPPQGYPPQGYPPQGYPPQQGQPIYQPPAPKPGMSAGKVVLIVLGCIALLIFGTCAVCSLMVGGAASAVEKQKQEEEAKIEAAMKDCATSETVDWATVVAAMKENEAKVAASWKGSCVKISGIVDDVASTFNDEPVVHISGGERFSMQKLHCRPKDKSKALELKKGQKLTVWGLGGDEIVGSLMLDHCDW